MPNNNYIDYYKVREPDDETKVALQWYDGQPKYIQEMVDVVGRWNNPPLVAVG
jgi:hypothetical protein